MTMEPTALGRLAAAAAAAALVATSCGTPTPATAAQPAPVSVDDHDDTPWQPQRRPARQRRRTPDPEPPTCLWWCPVGCRAAETMIHQTPAQEVDHDPTAPYRIVAYTWAPAYPDAGGVQPVWFHLKFLDDTGGEVFATDLSEGQARALRSKLAVSGTLARDRRTQNR